ncbi:hypothetical protein DEJ46_00890 [Streptomyces venezuelae]|uniref:Uncharacterized protein n=1 Tax=Streptomyces venezuelae TaxID=54571 RepID=A0A5P2AJ74_STRVZ|nr:hypothetical protein DEJ46_00890 [Streptomyces venezuelae]
MWSADGTWERVFTALPAQTDADEEPNWVVPVDSTIAPSHHHAAGAREEKAGVLITSVVTPVGLDHGEELRCGGGVWASPHTEVFVPCPFTEGAKGFVVLPRRWKVSSSTSSFQLPEELWELPLGT